MSISNRKANKCLCQQSSVKSLDLFHGIYIPQEYRKKVIRHLILNYSRNINGMQPSLFLAIQGFRGEGKTFMLQTICENYNIEMTYISGADLCGPNEGDSKNKIKKAYESACIEFSRSKKLSVIVIDDFHLSIASDLGDNVSKTTNAQVLVGYLMNLADNPYVFNIRIPIILLGNNFENIYPALTRNGRMDFYNWEPEITEKINMVYYMYKKFYPNIMFDDVEKLVKLYSKKYVAFFKDVIQDLFFKKFESIVYEFEQNKGRYCLDEIDDLVMRYLDINTEISLESLKEAAYKRNFIKEKNFEKCDKKG